ncbi:adhesin [Mycoplasmoides pneumoniae]|uniref:Adhesin P1 homolog n=1 Tax=Mycoplasmoides pneumoniae 309 TaxID=1112856 RepID=A0AB33HQB0_MYCPM|nr:adhesin [Mycoplasmoides pneumoniae]BAL21945.1 adhesin P1 homolog [Mycoplasmoides pneumoniae 309]BAV20602.1 adhesin P1 homolog [Mycoplasmoides pneumoniae]
MLKLAVGIFISPTLTRFSTGFNLAVSVLDQVLDYVPWIGNGHRYGNNHRGVNDITAPKTGAGSSSGTSTNTSGSRSFLPTFSNVGVGLKANVQGTLGGSQTTTTGKDIPKWPTLDPANLQLWTGAGWRNDKASNKQSDENHTTFKSATGSGQQGGSTTGGSAGNPGSLKQDKISKSGQNLTTQDGAPQSNSTTESASNYDHLPPTSPPHPIYRTRCHSPTRTTRSAPSSSSAACWAASRCWWIEVGQMIPTNSKPPTKNGLTPT